MKTQDLSIKLKKIEEGILVTLVALMGLALFLQIVMRFIFNSPMQWPEEFGRYCQIWITFLGIGYGLRTDSHVGMTILSAKFSFFTKHIVNIFCSGIGLFISCVLLISAIKFISYQNVLSTAMSIPMYIIYIIIPISAVICIFYYLIEVTKSLRIIIKKGVVV